MGIDRLECLLVMRHGRSSMLDEVTEVAVALRDLRGDLTRLKPEWVEHSGSTDAERTAAELARHLRVGAREAPPKRQLGPPTIDAYSTDALGAVDEARRDIDQLFRSSGRCFAIVGNKPALDWLLAPPWTKEKLTLGRSELACLVRPKGSARPWAVWWVLTPERSGHEAIAGMRQKLTSKMTVLSVLAGFTLAAVVTLLVERPDAHPQRELAVVAATLLSLSGIVFIVALLAYDRLLLPTHFWRTEPPERRADPYSALPVSRPPISASWVLYQSSIRIWLWVERAVYPVASALAVLTVAALWPLDVTDWVAVAVSSVLLAAFAWRLWQYVRPRFGF